MLKRSGQSVEERTKVRGGREEGMGDGGVELRRICGFAMTYSFGDAARKGARLGRVCSMHTIWGLGVGDKATHAVRFDYN